MGAAGGNGLRFAIVVIRSVGASQLPRGRAQRANFLWNVYVFTYFLGDFAWDVERFIIFSSSRCARRVIM